MASYVHNRDKSRMQKFEEVCTMVGILYFPTQRYWAFLIVARTRKRLDLIELDGLVLRMLSLEHFLQAA